MVFNNGSKQDIIEYRREMVSRLRLCGLTVREIAEALGRNNPPLLNPDTGAPYTHVTVENDLKALRVEWKARRKSTFDEHIDRQFMELQEIKRAGWAGGEPELALKSLREEISLLGTRKAQELNINFTFDVEIVMRLVEAIQARGEDATQWFKDMLQEFADADSEEVQIAQDILNAHRDTN